MAQVPSPLTKSSMKLLGVHSLSLERETSTGVLANFSREFANFEQELALGVKSLCLNCETKTFLLGQF